MNRKTIIKKILGSAILSIALEAITYPKPLAVDRLSIVKGMSIENFLATASYISLSFYETIIDAFKNKPNIGKRIFEATISMLENQSKGNTSLGSIMLLIPLIYASTSTVMKEKPDIETIKQNLSETLALTSYRDSIYFCKSILAIRPKWLVKVSKFDLTKENWTREIKEEKANLKKLLEEAKSYDWIAYEYCNDFEITFRENYPYFKKAFEDFKNINIASLKTYLWILNKRFDSHIYRKKGIDVAQTVQNRAKFYYERIEKGEDIISVAYNFKKEFENSDFVAGTSADLLVATLFLSLITFLKI